MLQQGACTSVQNISKWNHKQINSFMEALHVKVVLLSLVIQLHVLLGLGCDMGNHLFLVFVLS